MKTILVFILFLTSFARGFSQTPPPKATHKSCVLKIKPLSVLNNNLSLSFEKVLKPGVANLEIESGFANKQLSLNPFFGLKPNFYNSKNQLAFTTCMYLKLGFKFLIGKDYSKEGIKNAHPLCGRYLRVDLASSYLNFQDVVRYGSFLDMKPLFYASQTSTVTSTNIKVLAYGGFLNYGRQFMLGHHFTLDYYFGIGLTLQSHRYSNPNFLTGVNTIPIINRVDEVTNYYGFFHTNALSSQYGLRIGYIIPYKNKERT